MRAVGKSASLSGGPKRMPFIIEGEKVTQKEAEKIIEARTGVAINKGKKDNDFIIYPNEATGPSQGKIRASPNAKHVHVYSFLHSYGDADVREEIEKEFEEKNPPSFYEVIKYKKVTVKEGRGDMYRVKVELDIGEIDPNIADEHFEHYIGDEWTLLKIGDCGYTNPSYQRKGNRFYLEFDAPTDACYHTGTLSVSDAESEINDRLYFIKYGGEGNFWEYSEVYEEARKKGGKSYAMKKSSEHGEKRFAKKQAFRAASYKKRMSKGKKKTSTKDKKSKSKKKKRVYVDNAMNRKLGRVGKTY